MKIRYKPLYETKDQEKTPQFKKWFGKSKIVDKSGNPLVVYHGTNYEFNIFNVNKMINGWLSKGFYFSENKEDTKSYGKIILSVYLSIKNPFVIDIDKINKDGSVEIAKSATEQIINKFPDIKKLKDASRYLKNKGYDGIMQGNTLIVAFYPNQIKSAIGNNGNFNPKSNNITECWR